jgi:RNA polymerase sigma-70 factor (ECF subfamily)
MALAIATAMRPDRFQDLYDSYGPAIFARCCRLLDDRSAAEDAAQEVFLRVHRHIGAAPANDEALRWMFRITTNYCLNMLRDQKLRPMLTDDLSRMVDGRCSEERVADRDLGRRLAMRAPAHLRAVAWLHHVEGLAQHEVAQQLGISRRTVVNYLSAFNEYAARFPGVTPARPLSRVAAHGQA